MQMLFLRWGRRAISAIRPLLFHFWNFIPEMLIQVVWTWLGGGGREKSIFTLETAFAWKGSEWWDICIFFLYFHPIGVRISLSKHYQQQCFHIFLNKILGVTLNYVFIYVQALRTMALVNAGKVRTRCPITDLIFTFFWQCSFMYGVQIDEVSVSLVVAQLPIHVRLFATLWTAPHQASLSLTISWGLPKFMLITSMMLSSKPSHPLMPSSSALYLSQHEGLFQWVSCSCQMMKILELQLQHQSYSEYSGLISLKIDWFDLLAVQGNFRNLLQHHSSKAPLLWHSAFFTVLLSQLYMTTGNTIALTIRTFVGRVMSLFFNTLSRF